MRHWAIFFSAIAALLTVPLGQASPPIVSQCSLSRLDVLPCVPEVTVPMPGRNQYGVYSTRIRSRGSGPYCRLRRKKYVIANIDDLSTTGLKLLFSPGYERQPRQKYLNQILVEYNIDCGQGKSAYLTISSMDMEPENCPVSSSSSEKCQDYIEVISEHGGTREFCGRDASDGVLLLGAGHFRMRLRTSDSSRYPGFAAYVVCFQNARRVTSKPGVIAPKGTCTRVQRRDPFATEFQVENVNQDRYFLDSLSEDRYEMPPLEEISQSVRHVSIKAPSLVGQPSPDLSARGTLPALSLTASEKQVLDAIVSPLFREAFDNARRRMPVWPPPGFDDEDDDDHNNDLVPPTLPDIILPFPDPPLLKLIKEDLNPGIPRLPEPRQQFKRSILPRRVHSLDSLATRTAVVYQDACNPVLQAATKSFLGVARRMNPSLLKTVENQVRREQGVLPAFE